MSNGYTYIVSEGGGKSSKVYSYLSVSQAKSPTAVSLPDSASDADGRGDVMEAWATVKKAANDKVEGALYSQSFTPFSQQFLTLSSAFSNGT